jgi:redox-sensitive bicupin YhaK (pirin superfamily)
MTAGAGIMHEEMPRRSNGMMAGFQLWVNLPARIKMTRPRYQEVLSAQIPELDLDGAQIRVIAGSVAGTAGAVTEIAADPTYLDVSLPTGGSFSQPIAQGHSAFAYVFEGSGVFGASETVPGHVVSHPALVVLDDGDYVQVSAPRQPVRFLLVSGRPLNEPIVRYGPFVMNTVEEIEQALSELRSGGFVRSG